MTWDGGAVIASVALVGGWIRYSLRSMIREEIRSENEVQLAKINGTYLRSMGADLTGKEIERRLEALEARKV